MTAFLSCYPVDCHVRMLKRFFPLAFSGSSWIIDSNANIPHSLTLRNKYSYIKNKCQVAYYQLGFTLHGAVPKKTLTLYYTCQMKLVARFPARRVAFFLKFYFFFFCFKNYPFSQNVHQAQSCYAATAAPQLQKGWHHKADNFLIWSFSLLDQEAPIKPGWISHQRWADIWKPPRMGRAQIPRQPGQKKCLKWQNKAGRKGRTFHTGHGMFWSSSLAGPAMPGSSQGKTGGHPLLQGENWGNNSAFRGKTKLLGAQRFSMHCVWSSRPIELDFGLKLFNIRNKNE